MSTVTASRTRTHLRCAEGGWLRPQAEEALINAAMVGDLATLTRLVEEGVNVNATNVGAAPPAAPSPLRPSPVALAARHPCYPALSLPPLTACGAAAAPPQNSFTALMCAAANGKFDCLEYLIAKGANLYARTNVRRGPAAPPAAPHSRPPLTACGAAAAPPQWGRTALMRAANYGNLDCLDYLIAKGANLNVQDNVRRGPAAAWRRGVWG